LKKEAENQREEIYKSYKDSLDASVEAINPVWDISLRRSPPPSREEAENAVDLARTQLGEARTKRLEALARFTNLLLQRDSQSAPNPVNAPDINRAPPGRRR